MKDKSAYSLDISNFLDTRTPLSESELELFSKSAPTQEIWELWYINTYISDMRKEHLGKT